MAIYWGDTHGNFPHMRWEFSQGRKRNIIHVGDFGMIFWGEGREKNAKDTIAMLNEALVKQGSHAYINRGNHDDPQFWQDGKWDRCNIKFVPNYSVINIEGKMTLFLGGAISVDRSDLPAHKWFEDEGFVYDEAKIDAIMRDVPQIDVVVSHTAPEFCYPLGLNDFVYKWAKDDPKLLQELPAERKLVGDVYRVLNTKFNIKRWVYGHFHTGNTMYYNETEFTCMGINSHSRNTY